MVRANRWSAISLLLVGLLLLGLQPAQAGVVEVQSEGGATVVKGTDGQSEPSAQHAIICSLTAEIPRRVRK